MNQEFESSPELCSKSISGKASQSSIKFNLLRASWNISLLYLTAQHGYTLYVDFMCPYNKAHRLYGDWDLKLTLWSLAAQNLFRSLGFACFSSTWATVSSHLIQVCLSAFLSLAESIWAVVAEVESQGGGTACGKGKECFWKGHKARCEPGGSNKGWGERTDGGKE